ncbi:flagellar filament capping protein FliD [Enterococcus italicus]|uniref:flagellar filament capping protein FliD n=1 Tax=Enterococcus italicus TaxID=246144 RepID=UPI0020733241|nr:flagellar filament capping protein FliD [Enterococcus italicus]MCM6881381.1 flagellar filament capping protein FliD [Enterococcus italicus]
MASITSSSGISTTLGSYSGVTSDDIEKLLSADTTKKMLAQNKITTINDQKTAWNDVRTRLNSLLSKVEELQKAETFATKKVTNSDESIASITTTADAAENDFSLKITQLATTTKLIGNKLSDSSKTALGISGSFSLTNSQDKTFTFTVESTDTLKSLTDKINVETKNSAISASIIDNRLVLTSSTTGEHAITVAGESADALGISSTKKASYSLGQQAEFELDGLALKSDSNSVSNVVEGVTFTLKKASTDSTTIKVTTDTDKTVQAVKDLVSQYNSTMSFISDNLSVGDPSKESNTTGKLQGDSTLRSLQERLSSLFTSSAVTGTSLKANDVGISLIDRDGTLGLDEDKLKKALSEDGNAVKNFFYQTDGAKSTIASTSNVSETNGYTAVLKKLVDGYLVDTTANKGIIATKAATFDLAIKDLNKQITRFDEILTMKRDRYVDMFTRLDQAMMEAESQLSYFTTQASSNG